MNTMSSYDPIDEALNTTSAIEVSNTPENGCITRKDSTKNITDDIELDKSNIVKICGYTSVRKDGSIKLNYIEFYQALLSIQEVF